MNDNDIEITKQEAIESFVDWLGDNGVIRVSDKNSILRRYYK